MKALSILQPGGTRIATGEKTVEVRDWVPDIPMGEDLLIVETHQPPAEDGEPDPNGRIVAIVKIKAVNPFKISDLGRACALVYEEGQFAWELTDIRAVHPPKGPVSASRNIFDLDISLDQLLGVDCPRRRSA